MGVIPPSVPVRAPGQSLADYRVVLKRCQADTRAMFPCRTFWGYPEEMLRRNQRPIRLAKIIELARTTRRTMSEITAKAVSMAGSGLPKEQIEQAVEDWATNGDPEND